MAGGQKETEDMMPRGRDEDATPNTRVVGEGIANRRRSAKTCHGQTS